MIDLLRICQRISYKYQHINSGATRCPVCQLYDADHNDLCRVKECLSHCEEVFLTGTVHNESQRHAESVLKVDATCKHTIVDANRILFGSF